VRRVVGSTVVVAAIALAGCGPLSRAELTRGVETLSAVAAEAQLVARGVASDRTRATYTRVQARTLAEDAAHEAEKLADASVEGEIARQRDQAVALAMRLDDTIGELETFPGSERTGSKVDDDLGAIADDIDKLTQRLTQGP